MKCGSTESTARKARLMRGNGITYDPGFFNAGVSTHEPFDPEVVKREMRIIHDDLHCNAVRITGGNADRLEIAAIHAADASLEVWFSPFTCDLTTDELLDFLADCAERAERLRRQGAEVVFVTGAELSLFTVGFLPGDTLEDRLDLFAAPHRLRELLPLSPPKGADTAFANTFASYHLPPRRNPRADLDMASYGVVKVLEDRPGHSYPDMAWEPKAAFTALADSYHG